MTQTKTKYWSNTLIVLTSIALTSSQSNANNIEQAASSISAKALSEHVKTLSSDEFEGRSPTSIGETKTLNYLTNEFKKLGVKPGNNGSYTQAVTLTEITPNNVSLNIAGEDIVFKENMVLSAHTPVTSVEVKDSELVFVGFGVNAPEYQWNDYANIDVKGKTVVMLVNDPGFESVDGKLFQGKTMTYYGRWTYKYEEAKRQGAAAALIVHETAPASYPWSVVENGWGGSKFTLATSGASKSSLKLEGWIDLKTATHLFKKAGQDFSKLKRKALTKPTAIALNLPVNASVTNTLTNSDSYNFIATIEGTSNKDEHIVYSAHWDHLGKNTELDGDQIYNGAHDNATGTGGIIEIARAFMQLSTAPKRSITFLATTAEEQGLLGSAYYAQNPVYPIEKTVANINIDSLNILGRTKDLTVIGIGKSEVEQHLTNAAKSQNRYLTQEASPQAGGYYRSDHFNFAKQGVPAIFAGGGQIPFDELTKQYREKISAKVKKCYHQLCDEYNESWDLSGAVQDLQLFFQTGLSIANDENWPKWYKTSEFQRK